MHVVDYLSRRPYGHGLCGVWETAGPLFDIQTLASERSSALDCHETATREDIYSTTLHSHQRKVVESGAGTTQAPASTGYRESSII